MKSRPLEYFSTAVPLRVSTKSEDESVRGKGEKKRKKKKRIRY